MFRSLFAAGALRLNARRAFVGTLSRLRRAMRRPSAPLRLFANRFAVGAFYPARLRLARSASSLRSAPDDCQPLRGEGQSILLLTLLTFSILHFPFSILSAAPPTLDALFPPGAPAGSETAVTITGKTDPWPCAAWCSDPSIVLTPDKDKKSVLKITVPKEAAPGPVLLRLHNAEGASEPRIFVIGALPEHNEDSKHVHTLPDPEPIAKLPVTINGRLAQSGDIDIYRIPLEAGDTLVARVDGYGLRSGIDPYLHLYDPGGIQVALGNDNGRNLDPLLIHRVARTGAHLVAIMAYETPPGSDVKFTGSAKNVYRLTLTTEPKAHPGVPPDSKIPATLAPPFALEATVAKPAETDRFTFSAKKSQSLLVKVSARDFGSPLDPVLTLADSRGKTLRSADDAGKSNRDAETIFKIPADGDYTAAVTDRFRKGSPQHHYRIEVAEPEATFAATLDKSAYLLEPTKTVALKLKLKRLHGHDTPLAIEIPALPKGITFEQPGIPAKSGEFTLTLEAAAGTPPAGQPIAVHLVETGDDKPATHPASFSFQDDNARGPYLIDATPDIWLTVKSAKK